jgi:hypothetical protein
VQNACLCLTLSIIGGTITFLPTNTFTNQQTYQPAANKLIHNKNINHETSQPTSFSTNKHINQEN